MNLQYEDPLIYHLIEAEKIRQDNTIELIASENFPTKEVMEAVGSCMMSKYTEGYPGKRYYGGCENFDVLETECQKRWLKVFNCEKEYGVNVQPHSGSNANMAAYAAILSPGDTVLGMDLNFGG